MGNLEEDCVYIFQTILIKAIALNELSEASLDGFQQQWLKVQCRSYKSFLVCNVYRPPSTPINYGVPSPPKFTLRNTNRCFPRQA